MTLAAEVHLPVAGSLAAFVRERVAPDAARWERERAVPPGPLATLGASGLTAACARDDAAGLALRLELAEALGAAGSLGTAATLLHAVGAPPLLGRLASPAVRERFLAPALAGRAVGAVAWAPAGGAGECTLRDGGDGTVELDGVFPCVVGLPGAEWAVVAARDEAGGDAAVVVPLATAGARVEPRRAVGLHAASLGELRLERCRVAVTQRLVAGDALDRALADERLVLCATLLAAADRVFRDTLAFVGTRSFGPGRVLGDQQVVRHRLADLAAELEVARAFLGEVAAARAFGPASPSRAALLALVCADAARAVADGCVQLRGARGYMAGDVASTAYRDLLAVGLLPAFDPGALQHAAAADLFAAPAVAPVRLATVSAT